MRPQYAAAALSALCLLLAGCRVTEAEDVRLVAGVAVDIKDGTASLTAETVKTGTGSDLELESEVLSASGADMETLMDIIESQTDRHLEWDHAQVIIVGEETAQKDLGQAVRTAVTECGIRLTSAVLIAGNTDAASAISAKTDEITSFFVKECENKGEKDGRYSDSSALTVLKAIENGDELLLPCVFMTDDGKPVVTGSAIITEGRLSGYYGKP